MPGRKVGRSTKFRTETVYNISNDGYVSIRLPIDALNKAFEPAGFEMKISRSTVARLDELGPGKRRIFTSHGPLSVVVVQTPRGENLLQINR